MIFDSIKNISSIYIPCFLNRVAPLRGLRERNIREVYHLWQLAGGQAEQELVKQNIIHSHPPILTMPSIATLEGEVKVL